VEALRALVESLSWQSTSELPEMTLAKRTPKAQPPATEEPNKRLAEWMRATVSIPSLYYVQIDVNHSDQLQELDELGAHYVLLGVKGVTYAHLLGRKGHELHQAHGAVD
jgi:hypothetical protein